MPESPRNKVPPTLAAPLAAKRAPKERPSVPMLDRLKAERFSVPVLVGR